MKIGVLVSGEGTNLQALLDAQRDGQLGAANIVVVISNKPGVPAIERANRASVPCVVIEHGKDRVAFEDKLLAELHNCEAVVLAGFMRILSEHFISKSKSHIINTHPSLLPAFPGANAAQQAIDHGVKWTGVTIHFVDNSLDGGPIIDQRPVEVLAGDTAETLQKRIQAVEHPLLVDAVRALAGGELSCEGRRVVRVRAQ